MAKHNPKGTSQIQVICEGYTVLADVKTKTFNRFVDKAVEYDYWEGVINGKLLRIQGPQLILSHAGIQCYEKKPKD